MNKRIIAAAFFAAFSSVLWSCETKTKKEETTTTATEKPEPVKLESPAFNADSAYAFTAAQVSFGPRIPNTEAHVKAGDYLIAKLKEFGAEVTVQSFESMAFDGKMLKMRNIIGTINPAAKKRVMLSAHWDTRPWADKDYQRKDEPIDGANDSASGVGILLEVARVINEAKGKPDIGVDIVLFDGEDYGYDESTQSDKVNKLANSGVDTWCLGSQYWMKNKHVPGYDAAYGILLDMVGSKTAKFAKDESSRSFAGGVLDKVWSVAQQIGYGDYFVNVNTPGITDDHYYVNQAGIPMIDIIEYNPLTNDYFAPYHHTHQDNMSIIERRSLKAVGQTLLEVLYRE
ncbi:M28 family peptidase [Adhaeribacter soli]|uniref:M28 family peptidase n=1 Tax=Adhaeribacter soli TaxID=2607655 RepID=A0A5N1J707_9BACT|nr:M28 family peptidase [Adhaeribacter soli]KAA9340977.1 M28 family peptidase [Adhaeribacter soli]